MRIHMVKQGDTLYGLGEKYRVSVEQIIALNPQIADPNRVELGTKVKIPSAPKPVAPPAMEIAYKHVVQQGDSLWKLGKAWDVPLQAMLQANPHLKNPNVLMTGDIVFIPKWGATPHEPQPVPQPELPQEVAPPAEEMPQVVQEAAPAAPQVAEEAMPAPMPMPEEVTVIIAPAAPAEPDAEEPAVISGPSADEVGLPAGPLCPPPLSATGGDIGLSQPYPQAAHPFKQLEITATEVFASGMPPAGAYDPAAAGMPAYPPAFPWEAAGVGGSTYGLPMPNGMPSVAAAAGGCGCGGPAAVQPMPGAGEAWPGAGFPAAMYPPQMLPAAVPQMGQPPMAAAFGLPMGPPPFPTGPAGAPGPMELYPGPCYPVGGDFSPPWMGAPGMPPAGGPMSPMPYGMAMPGGPMSPPFAPPMGGPGFGMPPAGFPQQGMPGMSGMSAMPGMPGMPGMSAMPGMPGMSGMSGMPGMPAMSGMPGIEEAYSGTPLLSPQVKTHQLTTDMEEEKVELDVRPSKNAAKSEVSGKIGSSAVRKAKSRAAGSASLHALTRKRPNSPARPEAKANGPWINV
ncbi:LysM peptidoglycan-binding domain-containing protein [Paenibacillus athensensis]|uniref:LysM peptidoglycan-binding domain-containing protein n=1 Tax=Paenibacillus athensensis TaxID=1967502 RepID=UPI00142FCE36|nr:LysM peptidoglycan-binding domain-containing protein [Paenibacillus athensensis]MCD1258229.1 LysM peptidoglycan-binding domain-containing protein [Paenibacillus athensensis]